MQIHPNPKISTNRLNGAKGEEIMNSDSLKTKQDDLTLAQRQPVLNKGKSSKSIEGSNRVVLAFFDHWTKTGLGKSQVIDESKKTNSDGQVKPASLFRADNAFITTASSLTVSKMSKLDTNKPTIEEIALDAKVRTIIEEAKDRVALDLKPYVLEKEKQDKKELLIKIETSQMKFPSEKERMELLEKTKDEIREVASELRVAKPQYTKALKSLRKFATVMIQCSNEISDADVKDIVIGDCISFLEDMMSPVETSWKGIPGKSEDLPFEKPEDMSILARAKQIKDHLTIKIEAIDAKQFKRLEKVATQPIMQKIIDKHKEGKLPEDGSIFFFIDSKRPLLRIDACANPRPRPGQSKDSAIKHAVKTPEFLDVVRLEKGIGPDGAGLFRFAELADRITGAVILSTVTQNGKAVKLPGMSKPKRQVHELIGSVPECVQLEMTYGAVLNKFRPIIERLLAERNLR